MEGESLRKSFQASPLRKDRNQLLPVALRVEGQDLAEANDHRRFTGFSSDKEFFKKKDPIPSGYRTSNFIFFRIVIVGNGMLVGDITFPQNFHYGRTRILQTTTLVGWGFPSRT